MNCLILMLALIVACNPLRSKNDDSRPETSDSPPSYEPKKPERADPAKYYYILTYAKAGNADLSVLRKYMHNFDVNALIDQDLMREREFTAYPYTVDTYLVAIKDMEGLQSLKDAAFRYPSITTVIVPIEHAYLKTYLQIKYVKPVFRTLEPNSFWVGDSPKTEIGSNLLFAFENPTSYGQHFANCKYLNSACLKDLLKENYFQTRTLVDSHYRLPADYVLETLAESIRLRSSGYSGRFTVSGEGILNLDYDRSPISDLVLKHEVWFSGEPIDSKPDDIVLKLGEAIGKRVGSVDAQGNYYFSLPVGVPNAQLEPRVRESQDNFLVQLQEFESVLSSELNSRGK